MKQEEYVRTVVVGNTLIPVGLNDGGQTYFFEYLDTNGALVEECCGSYNTDYMGYIEYKFGDPSRDCKYFKEQSEKDEKTNCNHRCEYGYCAKCEYENVEWYAFQKLVNLGILDRRGNVTDVYKPYIVKKEQKESNEN